MPIHTIASGGKSGFGGHVGSQRYDDIRHLSGAAFCRAQHKIHEQGRMDFAKDKSWIEKEITSSYTVCACNNCGCAFAAKKADRKRGWAKFCSKTCKAQL